MSHRTLTSQTLTASSKTLIITVIYLQAVRSMYREWETGISFSATIQKNTVSLYIPADPWEVDNWELFLLKSHTVRDYK